MLAFLSENIGSILVLCALVAVVALIAVKTIRDRRAGKSSCGSGCAHCPMSGKCHKKK